MTESVTESVAETDLIQFDADNRLIITAEGAALLFGVTADEARAYFNAHGPHGDGATPFPQEWIQAGHRRAREAAAATGQNDFTHILCYWARKQSPGVDVLVVVREKMTDQDTPR